MSEFQTTGTLAGPSAARLLVCSWHSGQGLTRDDWPLQALPILDLLALVTCAETLSSLTLAQLHLPTLAQAQILVTFLSY